MKYPYSIEEDKAVITVTQRNGRSHLVIVDLEDLVTLRGWNISISPYNCQNDNFYATINRNCNEERYLLHRYILQAPVEFEVDHIDGNGLNNSRKDNLRFATPKQNQANRRGAQCNSKTGIRGVAWDKKMKKYRAKVSGVDLGYFADITEATHVVTTYRALNFPFSRDARTTTKEDLVI